MNKEYYCRQKFLFESSYEEINLEHHYDVAPDFLQNYTEPINLFDTDNNIYRAINIAELDSEIDNAEDFEKLLAKMNHINTVYILNSRLQTDNPILETIKSKSLKAYIYYFESKGKNCKVLKVSTP